MPVCLSREIADPAWVVGQTVVFAVQSKRGCAIRPPTTGRDGLNVIESFILSGSTSAPPPHYRPLSGDAVQRVATSRALPHSLSQKVKRFDPVHPQLTRPEAHRTVLQVRTKVCDQGIKLLRFYVAWLYRWIPYVRWSTFVPEYLTWDWLYSLNCDVLIRGNFPVIFFSFLSFFPSLPPPHLFLLVILLMTIIILLGK
jgi:hypothetical protein